LVVRGGWGSSKSSGEKQMRKVKEMQMKLGEVTIADITFDFDLRSRDEIPKLLLGLQHVWCTPGLREKVFEILEKIVPVKTRADTGRPGMELWKILVLGATDVNYFSRSTTIKIPDYCYG
jgi:hypothetical protein